MLNFSLWSAPLVQQDAGTSDTVAVLSKVDSPPQLLILQLVILDTVLQVQSGAQLQHP